MAVSWSQKCIGKFNGGSDVLKYDVLYAWMTSDCRMKEMHHFDCTAFAYNAQNTPFL